jgi:sugar lactone lactonase YvrE
MVHPILALVMLLSLVIVKSSIPPQAPPIVNAHPGIRTIHHLADRAATRSTLADAAVPLPGGCGGVSPGGESLAACCVSGFVYMDGLPIAGAELQISSARGNQAVQFTHVYSGTEARPYYRISLSVEPLAVVPGETITITARYSGHTRSVTQTVLPGGQQVDVVLARDRANDYLYERQIWGQADAGGLNAPRGVAVDSTGRLFVADTDNARIQIFDQAGQFSRQWGTLGNQPGQFSQPGGIAVDTSGNIYVADSNNHRIQKFSSQGAWIMSWGGLGSADDQLHSPWGLATDAADNLYVADTQNDRVQKFSSTGAFLRSWGGQGFDNGQFNQPSGIALDADGNVYVVDLGNDRVQKFSDDGVWLMSWALGSGIPPSSALPRGIAVSGTTVYVANASSNRIQRFSTLGVPLANWGGPGSDSGQFAGPAGIAVGDAGAIYVADSDNDRVQLFSSDGVWQANRGSHGSANRQFRAPSGVAISAANLYVADTASQRVQLLTTAGTWQRNLSGQFSRPWGVAVGGDGTVYVADPIADRIQRFSASGTLLTGWGSHGSADGQLNAPYGVAVGGDGTVYVADSSNHRIQRFSAAGSWLASWGNLGSADGQLNTPQGLAVAGDGTVYVADSSNHRIQRFSAAGSWLASWGNLGSADGQFNTPQGLAVDGTGMVYVADTGNDRIQKFNPSGSWLASWGAHGKADGQLSEPRGVAVDSSGRVYVADAGNNRIVVFRPMTYTLPIATINQLSHGSLIAGDTLVAIGRGQDSDETPAITGYRWSIDGHLLGLAATLTLSATLLVPGDHLLTLEVQDGEGQWSAPVSTPLFVAVPEQHAWTMLLYLAGDYSDRSHLLNQFNYMLERLRSSFRNPNLRIAVQVDGPDDGDTRRLLITPGTATSVPQFTEISYSERALDDPVVLSDFVQWGQLNFPAAHYYLAIADHGQAIQGIGWDATSDPGGSAYLTLKEIGQALGTPGIAPIDIVHLDASSMNLLETAYELRQQTSILIASQYLAWSYFAYDEYADTLNAFTSPRDAALGITARYAAHAQADHVPFTIAALDMQRAEPALSAVDHLAAELAALVDNSSANRVQIDAIWHASRKLDSNGDRLNTDEDLYVDLLDWAGRLAAQGPNTSAWSSTAVRMRAATLVRELRGPQAFVIAGSNRTGSGTLPPQYGSHYIDLSGVGGLSIVYPQRHDSTIFSDYIGNKLFHFTQASRWPDFLLAGLGVLPTPIQPPPGPLPSLDPPHRVMLPLIRR